MGNGRPAGDPGHQVLVPAAEAGDDVRLDAADQDHQVGPGDRLVDVDRRAATGSAERDSFSGSSGSGFSQRMPSRAGPTRALSSSWAIGRCKPRAGTTVIWSTPAAPAASSRKSGGSNCATGVGRLPSSTTKAIRIPPCTRLAQGRAAGGMRQRARHLAQRRRRPAAGRKAPGCQKCAIAREA